jgi:formamidopyrimidine-DNA glycosylase
MPELPDVTLYIERIAALFGGQPLRGLTVHNPFLLRSVGVPPAQFAGRRLLGAHRIGKRIALRFEGAPEGNGDASTGHDGELFAVIHLMIAGRLHIRPRSAKPNKLVLCTWDFGDTRLVLTEAGTKRRASLHLVTPRSALLQFERGGIEPLEVDFDTFGARLVFENRTLKRALTDPRLFSGIGNAYSDEILHRAQLSPVTRTQSLDAGSITRLYIATREVLTEWIERLRDEVGDGFPDKVTAFRPEMAVHGRFDQPCPVCGDKVQRIVHSNNEVNYCATCQTGGKLLRDGGLSRLLRADWPKTLEELEERRETLTLPTAPNPAVTQIPARKTTAKKTAAPKPRSRSAESEGRAPARPPRKKKR